MNRKQFTLYVAAIAAAMGAIMGYGISTGNILLPIIALVAGITLISLGRRKVTEVIEDERIYRISEKASRRTLQIFGIGAALTGAILITLREMTEVGYTLAFSACALVILYLVFYGYYSRRALD